jgi:hypothetical protein
MKKIILAFFVTLSFFSVFSQQNDTSIIFGGPLKSEFRIPFQYLIQNTLAMEYEYHLESTSVVIIPGVTVYQKEETEKLGAQLELQYRFYAKPTKDMAYKGIYIAPFARYRYLTINRQITTTIGPDVVSGKYTDTYNVYTVGFLGGIKLVAGNKISFDWNLGGGLRYSDESTNYPYVNNEWDYFDLEGIFSYGYTGILPMATFSFGMVF